jgi:16S rRNA (guanine1516-N2)-methyltransferase
MTTLNAAVAVAADANALNNAADRLASELSLPRCTLPCVDYLYVLTYSAACDPARLELHATHREAPGPVYVDFVAGAIGFRARHGSRNKEPLARAVGLKGAIHPTVLDATAGLGRDAFVLASLGCTVTLVERSPIIAALLRDGLARAAAHPGTRDISRRMQAQIGDAVAIMVGLADQARPDVVYLDPMYPHRGKSALVKKEMRLLRALVGEDLDAPRLLETALHVARKRVVVKRPRLAPCLPGIAPSHTMTGSTTRFDIYLCAHAASGE